MLISAHIVVLPKIFYTNIIPMFPFFSFGTWFSTWTLESVRMSIIFCMYILWKILSVQ